MKYIFHFFLLFVIIVCSCENDSEVNPNLRITSIKVGQVELLEESITKNVPVDGVIEVTFSQNIALSDLESSVLLKAETGNLNLIVSQKTASSFEIVPSQDLKAKSTYALVFLNTLVSLENNDFSGATYQFTTESVELELVSITYGNEEATGFERALNVPLNLDLSISFSHAIDIQSLSNNLSIGKNHSLSFYSETDTKVIVTSEDELPPFDRFVLTISGNLIGTNGEEFLGYAQEFYTTLDSTYKFPQITEEQLLTKVQEQTFQYFWDFAHPVSGLARERNTSGDLVTIGGSGFGVMAILAGIERGFITREQGVSRLSTIVDFLAQADRFHGVWPHWMNGNTGAVIPFSANDDGGDIVETAFMVQGLLTARQYLDDTNATEKVIIDKITQLWEAVEWDWYTQGENVIYWHWSPNFGFDMNLPVRGWNEALIVYVLAASSPTHSVSAEVYHQGWARGGAIMNGNSFYSIELPLGYDLGGPLFFEHYSFLGLDPRNLSDQYANYWTQATNHTLINQAHCIANPKRYVGYSSDSWGLTASDNHIGYAAHSPTNDLGVITPTAAISSIPYTPVASLDAIEQFYYLIGDRMWGPYGFYDAFNATEDWYADSYLAIDQGPIIIMIENYRSGLLWNNFMKNTEIKNGLTKLGFNY